MFEYCTALIAWLNQSTQHQLKMLSIHTRVENTRAVFFYQLLNVVDFINVDAVYPVCELSEHVHNLTCEIELSPASERYSHTLLQSYLSPMLSV